MDQGHCPDPVLTVVENVGYYRVLLGKGLHVQQAGYHLQIILNAVMDFLEQYLLFLESCAYLLFGLYPFGDVVGNDDALSGWLSSTTRAVLNSPQILWPSLRTTS